MLVIGIEIKKIVPRRTLFLLADTSVSYRTDWQKDNKDISSPMTVNKYPLLQENTLKIEQMGIKNFYFTYLWYDRNDNEKKVHAKISARPTIPETPFSFFHFFLFEIRGRRKKKKYF